MTDYRVLVSCPLIQDAMGEYDHQFGAHDIIYDVVEVDQQLNEDELLEIIDEYHGVIAGDDEFTRAVFERADRLQVISKWGIGTEAIDHDAAEKFGVAVYNTPGAFNDEVADVVIGYAVMLTRQLHLIDRSVRNGDWISPRGTSLADKTFGIVGVGDIGSAVAKRAHAHGLEVLGNDVVSLPDDLKEIGVRKVDKQTLFEEADLVSLNCVFNEATRKMVGETQLERLGEGGYIINTARGELINESALIEALQTGTISGAALDVFEEEPLSESSPLTEMDNVILGSHNAQNTTNAVSRVNDRAVENLFEGLVEPV
jgi:D-3-phosphoglycerate dehydrogenase